MNYSSLKTKLSQNGSFYNVFVDVNHQFYEEFSVEILNSSNIENKYQCLCEYLKEKYPDKQLKHGKILMNGILIGTFEVDGFENIEHDYLDFTFGKGVPGLIIHDVEDREDLRLIAKKHNTTISNIKHINSLDTEFLDVGQQLIISGKAYESME